MSELSIIGFDGIDGSGKTSIIKRLMSDNALKEKCIFTNCRNPSSPYVEKMYSILHTFKENFDALNLLVEDLLFRYLHLPKNKIILSDRTFISTFVFYKAISELSGIWDEDLHNRIKSYLQEYEPRLCVILLVDVDEARKRITQIGRPFKVVEEKPFQNLCAHYFKEVKPSDKILIIDTNALNESEVYTLVREGLASLDLDCPQ